MTRSIESKRERRLDVAERAQLVLALVKKTQDFDFDNIAYSFAVTSSIMASVFHKDNINVIGRHKFYREILRKK